MYNWNSTERNDIRFRIRNEQAHKISWMVDVVHVRHIFERNEFYQQKHSLSTHTKNWQSPQCCVCVWKLWMSLRLDFDKFFLSFRFVFVDTEFAISNSGRVSFSDWPASASGQSWPTHSRDLRKSFLQNFMSIIHPIRFAFRNSFDHQMFAQTMTITRNVMSRIEISTIRQHHRRHCSCHCVGNHHQILRTNKMISKITK